jgi:hypothetical protein
VSEQGREPGQADPWCTRRVMRLYAAGETIPQISRSVGWSEGRVRKVLREAGVFLTEKGAALARTTSEEARRRLLGAGWEARMRDGLVFWRRPDGRGSWYDKRWRSRFWRQRTRSVGMGHLMVNPDGLSCESAPTNCASSATYPTSLPR